MIKQIKEFTLDSIGEFLSQYAEKSESVYWLSSPNFEKIVYVSPAYEKIWGRKIPELYSNPPSWLDALVLEPGEQYNPIAEMAEKIAKHGSEARFEETYRIWRPDGEIRWILDHGFPVYDKNGNCCGVTGVATDITKSKQVEIALQAAKQRAESANKSKTDFLAKITHELRTPLNGILGNTELLEGAKNISTEQHDKINLIKSSGQHLLSLINELLDIATLESGKINLEQSPLSLTRLVNEIFKECAVIAEQKNLQLKYEYDENIPDIIGDKKRLKQIIINLVSNAIKFTQSGWIKISLKQIKIHNSTLTFDICVTDTGVGIPEDKQDFIFDKFNQVDDGLAGRSEGFGLGLAISREIIEAMGGNIVVSSRLNKGSTFTINLTLPIHQSTENKTDASAMPHQCHILVVEDHPINLKVVVSMLDRLNCTYDSAVDGKSALSLAKNNYYDLILTDISLPDIDGCEVARSIREDNQETPIIAVTAHTNADTKREVYTSGINDIIHKPITQKILQEKISAWHNSE